MINTSHSHTSIHTYSCTYIKKAHAHIRTFDILYTNYTYIYIYNAHDWSILFDLSKTESKCYFCRLVITMWMCIGLFHVLSSCTERAFATVFSRVTFCMLSQIFDIALVDSYCMYLACWWVLFSFSSLSLSYKLILSIRFWRCSIFSFVVY